MTAIWPDITLAFGVLSRFNHDPSHDHLVALKRMFWYLNGTKDWRLLFGEALGAALGRALGGALRGTLGHRSIGAGQEGALRYYVDSG